VISWKLHDKRFRFRSREWLVENYMTKGLGLGLGVVMVSWKLHDKRFRFRFRSREWLVENYMTKVKGLGLGVMSD